MQNNLYRSPRNRTLTCSEEELLHYNAQLKKLTNKQSSVSHILNNVLNQDSFSAFNFLPNRFVDLLFLDPPYNLSKKYNSMEFRRKEQKDYSKWFESMIMRVIPTLKDKAVIYVCSDWRTSLLIAPILEQYFIIQNRITWERSKGRGAKNNWKNNIEDIWFCSNSKEYYFNAEAVKIKKKVIAPYKEHGKPKDWIKTELGSFRMTYPSNIWTDISIPFWSMPENTHHPTQKPEKLLAKIILSSSKEDDIVLDPFLGSGTTAVAAYKLKRNFIGIELDNEYCCWALKRLKYAERDSSIQGYKENVFLERNSLLLTRN